MTKLSIITINYNNLAGLQRTVESVINQTWKEFEYIVIDGGSTDGSLAFIESQSDNIHYWVSEPDKGIYNAMNKGIAKASGEYLLFLNSGDDLNDLKVLEENHFHLLEKDIIYFDINVIGDGIFFVKKCPAIMTFSYLYHETLPHQSTFIRKELFKKIGYYDEDIKIVSDWKFFIIALIKHNATYKHVDAVISTFYLDGISFFEDYSNDRRQVLNEYFSEYVSDYDELFNNRNELVKHQNYLNTNRLKMLSEIEKTAKGRKIVSIFFRLIIIIISKKKLKDIMD
nr:glycosyltransferase family 2 protein [uncultured Flavobacterium sp.]